MSTRGLGQLCGHWSQKPKKGRTSQGGLTQNLNKKPTNYYGMSLRDSDNVEDVVQKAIMAPYYR